MNVPLNQGYSSLCSYNIRLRPGSKRYELRMTSTPDIACQERNYTEQGLIDESHRGWISTRSSIPGFGRFSLDRANRNYSLKGSVKPSCFIVYPLSYVYTFFILFASLDLTDLQRIPTHTYLRHNSRYVEYYSIPFKF